MTANRQRLHTFRDYCTYSHRLSLTSLHSWNVALKDEYFSIFDKIGAFRSELRMYLIIIIIIIVRTRSAFPLVVVNSICSHSCPEAD